MSKHILQYVTFYNKLQVRLARTFYNDKRVTVHMEQNVRKWRSEYELKVQKESNNKPADRSIFDYLLTYSAAPQMHDFFNFHFKHWWEYKKRDLRSNYERNYYNMNKRLGPDLTTAMYMLKHGGRVIFKNHDKWIKQKDLNTDFKLPAKFDLEFTLVALDLNGYPIDTSNLDHICNLYDLSWLSLRGCETIDDWAIDKLAGEYPMIEHLDVSECVNVTERALECLYKIPNLKKLIITDYYNSAALQLACFMLEDINPNLTCEIRKPEKPLLMEE